MCSISNKVGQENPNQRWSSVLQQPSGAALGPAAPRASVASTDNVHTVPNAAKAVLNKPGPQAPTTTTFVLVFRESTISQEEPMNTTSVMNL